MRDRFPVRVPLASSRYLAAPLGFALLSGKTLAKWMADRMSFLHAVTGYVGVLPEEFDPHRFHLWIANGCLG